MMFGKVEKGKTYNIELTFPHSIIQVSQFF